MQKWADEAIAERLSQLLSEQLDIRLALLFGSMASGRADKDSDIDLAVLTDRPLVSERKTQLIALLARESGRPVDLVDLQTAGLPILRSAVLGGRRLVCRDNTAFAALVSRTLIDSADFLPYRERLLKQRRDAWIG